VQDFDTEGGTWMNIPEEGVELQDGNSFTIGPHYVTFTFAEQIN
jgi:hypothetical protein